MDARARVTAALVLLLGACSSPRTAAPVPEATLKVTGIAVGRALSPDKRVTAESTTFGPADTIFASVVTEGRSSRASITARWTQGGALIAESSQRIAAKGTAVSEFHVSNPSGWAPGEYRVEILVDGRVVGERPFRVAAAS